MAGSNHFRGRLSGQPLWAAIALGGMLALALLLAAPAAGQTLDPNTIPKYENQLIKPPVYAPTVITDPGSGAVIRHDYAIGMYQFSQQLLPASMGLTTTVWGYGGMVESPGGPAFFQNAPGATFAATRGIPANVQWINNLSGSHLFAVDPTLHWANPNNMAMPMAPFNAFPPGYAQAQSPVPTVPHLHGGEVRSDSDGHPDAWFTQSGLTGPAYLKSLYTYPNNQEAATLWYHDHALGITRTNVLSGLAGFYLLSDPADAIAPLLPSGDYDIPLVVQDRSFNADGSLYFYPSGNFPDIHPYWRPMFFGNTIMVNGSVWPNLNVEPRQYRFRLLNGSNARFYNFSLSNGQSFTQIASDGGYLPAPATVTQLLLSPGERAEILIDFSGAAPGTQIILGNNAQAPYPMGSAPDSGTVGQVMRFTVTAGTPVVPSPLPGTLRTMPALTPDSPERTMTLMQEGGGFLNPQVLLLDGQKWGAAITELPEVGSTEDWVIANISEDAHPIHLHLVQFQVVSRQGYDSFQYWLDWIALNGTPPLDHPTQDIPVGPYLQGSPTPPAPGEAGWKDTVVAHPNQVTRIRVRVAPTDADPAQVAPGTNLFSFDPTYGPGYVWHCHILDHEDNEMMRPMKVTGCDRPGLSLMAPIVYWGSYADFLSRLLSAGWTIENHMNGTALGAAITASTATNEVALVTATPVALGDIASGESSSAAVKYFVPMGVEYFQVNIHAGADDTCGNSYVYP